MVHPYVSVKKSVSVVHVSNHKTFRICIDCGVPLPRSNGSAAVRCRSCSLKHRWKIYRLEHGLDG